MAAEYKVNYEPIENYFDQFCSATSFEAIIFAFERLCDAVNLKSLPGNGQFYKELRQRLSFYWKAEALFTKLDVRFNEETYRGQSACQNIQALVVGCGPCGLRSAVELALLGAKVVVIDKRTIFSRNNVLHLWPYLISDLKSLGAKSFFGKFCAGSIDHISIRTLQCILLKVALIFGVQIVSGVEFRRLIQPSDDIEEPGDTSDGIEDVWPPGGKDERSLRPLFTLYGGERHARRGWRVEVTPHHEALSAFEFEAIIDATGKSNSCLNFPRKALRCRLAIAITVNFINYGNVDEAHVEEISGVASIFNQPYFALISKKLGIELENLVYYKDETHYFVMTIKKKSLLAKGVLIKDLEDPAKLLSTENVNSSALEQLAKEVATFATQGGLRRLDFALNSRGQPDVAIFDFTSLSAAQYALRIAERQGRPLCQCLVGDALLEPFWPRGSGCALGFLSALDAAWAVSLFAVGHHALRVIAWRDSVYQRLSQASPSNMPPNFAAYSLLPTTRYAYTDLELVRPMQVRHLYDSDVIANMTERKSFAFLRDSVKFDDSDLGHTTTGESRNNCPTEHTFIPTISLLVWYQQRLSPYPDTLRPSIADLSAETWADGRALRCLLHKYRPDLVSEGALETTTGTEMGAEEVMRLLAENFGAPDTLTLSGWPQYLSVLHNCLKNHEPAFMRNMTVRTHPASSNELRQRSFVVASPTTSNRSINRYIDPLSSPRVASRVRPPFSPRSEYLPQHIHTTKRNPESPVPRPGPTTTAYRREDAFTAVEKGLMSKRKSEFLAMLNDPASAKRRSLLIDWEKAVEEAGLLPSSNRPQRILHPNDNQPNNCASTFSGKSRDFCAVCKRILYAAECRAYDGFRLHPRCFRCVECQRLLRPDTVRFLHHPTGPKFYCTTHFPCSSTPNRTAASDSKMCTRNFVSPKPRAHNTPSLFYDPSILLSPSRPRYNQSNGSSVASEAPQSARQVPSDVSNSISVARGIRDEPAPPVLLTSRTVPGTLGMPECLRRAAFDERLYRLDGAFTLEKFISSGEDERLEPGLSSNIESTCSGSPPINIDEAARLCRNMRDERFYRRHHPPPESSSDSEEEVESDEEDDPESDEDSQLISMDTFDTPQTLPEYANVRWTLVRPPPSPSPAPVPPTLAPSTPVAEQSPLVQKYGLSGSMLLAKQRFCMADPEPIRIDSRAFRATKNKERTAESILPDCTEQVELLPDTVTISLPFTHILPPSANVVTFSVPLQMVTVVPVRYRSSLLHVASHADPPESMLSLPLVFLDKRDSTASSVISECVHSISESTSFSRPLTTGIPRVVSVNRDSSSVSEMVPDSEVRSQVIPPRSSEVHGATVVLQTKLADTPNSTVVSDNDHVLGITPSSANGADVYSNSTLPTSGSEGEEEVGSDDGMDFLHRPLVLPPAELSAQLKENIGQTARQKSVPLYILTSKLDSDDDQGPCDSFNLLEDDDDEEDTSDSPSSDDFPPPISDFHAKQMVALRSRLSELEKEMRELEAQCIEKERALRGLEEAAGQLEVDLMAPVSSTSEPDLSATSNKLPKRGGNSRWRWVRPKRNVRGQGSGAVASHSPPNHEMTECSERARLFAELLAIISERNKLVTQEAVIMAELKKIKLEDYEESLQRTYHSLHKIGGEASQVPSGGGAFRLRGASRFRKERIYPASRSTVRENEKLLLNEISKISKEKNVLTAVQGEAMQRANLQELSLREVLNRAGSALSRAFSPPTRKPRPGP